MFFWSDKNGVVGSKLSFKYMYVLPQSPRPGGGGDIPLGPLPGLCSGTAGGP
jgi:hypothetical protein